MKKILNIFFCTLGVIFCILILIGGYLFITDPFNIKPLIFGDTTVKTPVTSVPTVASEDAHPLLNESQESALEKIGIDPASIPSEITKAQEMCFTRILGAQRIAEIKSGSLPTLTEYLQTKGCI